MKISREWIKKGFVHAAATFAYVFCIALFMSNIERVFDNTKPDTMFAPLFMLLLFIISATVTGILVLGMPAYLYFKNQWQDAVAMLASTIGWLVVFLVLVAGVIMLA